MARRATLRVVPEKAGERPPRERLEAAAAELRRNGFDVLRVGRMGVVVSGDDDLFGSILGVEPAAAAVQSVNARSEKLREFVDLAEFTPEPTLF